MQMRQDRRFFIPEVIQTSNMDCGPASLKCLLEGFGIDVQYDRLRELCRTDVDGTSIDTLEDIAQELGLDARQVMMPVDNLLIRDTAALPALAVVKLPNGNMHFVVVWNRVGSLVQVMNPGSGRVWKRLQDIARELYVHTATVPAAAWNEWARSPESLRVLRSRLTETGIRTPTIDAAISDVLAETTWSSIARLDAAARALLALTRVSAVRKRAEAEALFREWLHPHATSADIPESYWAVVESPTSAEHLLFRGAVLLCAKGKRTDITAAAAAVHVTAAQPHSPVRPLNEIGRMLREDGFLNVALITTIWAITSCELLVQTLLLRSIFGIANHLASRTQLLGGLLGLLALVFLLFLNRIPSAASVFRYGRRIEIQMRAAFLHKLPRLGDRYFQTRLTADMAERSHSIHVVKAIPFLASRIVTSFFELLMTTAGIIWIEPRAAPIAVAAGVIALIIPLTMQPWLTERDLRVRSHVGALGRFYLDAMIGLTAIRAHAAENAMRKEQRLLVLEWTAAAFAALAAAVTVEGVQAIVSTAAAAVILIVHLGHRPDAGGSLLLVYWALNLPVLANVFADAARRYPESRNVMLRLLEPIRAPEEGGDAEYDVHEQGLPSGFALERGMAICLEHVTVRSAGHTILDDVSVEIAAGEHVAIVGASGAGKSSLLSVILRWHQPIAGRVTVDDQPLDARSAQAVRRMTAWVDPAIQLWDSSLFDNLIYGSPVSPRLPEIIRLADLVSVLRHLPDGLQTPLGEGGGMLSGGEGQRVRLGRAIARADARLVILDEAFRGLDRDKRHQLMLSVRELWREATLLCVTHDIGETTAFNRVLVVDQGRIVEDGAPTELSKNPASHYSSLLNREIGLWSSAWHADRWRSIRLNSAGAQA